MVDTPAQRRLGVYYTPPLAAQAMAAWAIRSNTTRVMEPCFGSGEFLAAVKRVATTRRYTCVQTHGAELMGAAHSMAVDNDLIDADRAILGDFLGVSPFPVDAVIGNPPYVRLRSLPEDQLRRALDVTRETLGVPMETAGSVWMAFVLHAVRFLRKGGRIAFVLPHEFTHVRYARPLWKFLGDNFGILRVARMKERLFPDLMQEAILLFADSHGATTRSVSFEAYRTLQEITDGTPITQKQLPLRDIIEGSRPFLKALLPDELTRLLEDRLLSLTTPVRDSCTFNIGYVSGHKQFFHPDQQSIARFRLPASSLRRTLTATRELSGIGIHTSAIATNKARQLFYPNGTLSPEEERYIRKGEEDGVALGYKCSKRTPWYKVPDVRVPDFMLSVFKDTPSLVVNDAGLAASNSLLCGFLRPRCAPEQFIAAWYTSLTLLSCELQVHSLGGGVLVLIPGEVATIRLPAPGALPTTHIVEVDTALRSGRGSPYRLGDQPVLVESLKLTARDVGLIQEGVEALASWRNGARGPSEDSLAVSSP
ncbi:MAG: N-6 DNA methylase [bacterium]|nr:N-6 DNA methylase [bacterium]